MKTNLWLVLGVLLSTSTFAQPTMTSGSGSNAAPSFPPPAPLSKAAQEKLSHMAPIFDGKTLDGWKFSSRSTNTLAQAWTVKDGAIASLGADRDVLYTANNYGSYRIVFDIRHISGNKDHRACVLFFCTAPEPGKKDLDALGGVQFQVPNGGNWDYRPGFNKGGGPHFTKVAHPTFNEHEWSRVEILVNTNGTARMAVSQPVGTTAYEVLDFNDPAAGKVGPFGLQMHNKGLFDEYKDLRIEENPAEDKLITLDK